MRALRKGRVIANRVDPVRTVRGILKGDMLDDLANCQEIEQVRFTRRFQELLTSRWFPISVARQVVRECLADLLRAIFSIPNAGLRFGGSRSRCEADLMMCKPKSIKSRMEGPVDNAVL